MQNRLARLQLSQIVHRKRAIILFEGWMGAGKKAVLKRLAGTLDPTHVNVVKVAGSAESEDERHWLARFWSNLPTTSETTIFYRSWYRLIVEQRMSRGGHASCCSRAARFRNCRERWPGRASHLCRFQFILTAGGELRSSSLWREARRCTTSVKR